MWSCNKGQRHQRRQQTHRSGCHSKIAPPAPAQHQHPTHRQIKPKHRPEPPARFTPPTRPPCTQRQESAASLPASATGPAPSTTSAPPTTPAPDRHRQRRPRHNQNGGHGRSALFVVISTTRSATCQYAGTTASPSTTRAHHGERPAKSRSMLQPAMSAALRHRRRHHQPGQPVASTRYALNTNGRVSTSGKNHTVAITAELPPTPKGGATAGRTSGHRHPARPLPRRSPAMASTDPDKTPARTASFEKPFAAPAATRRDHSRRSA